MIVFAIIGILTGALSTTAVVLSGIEMTAAIWIGFTIQFLGGAMVGYISKAREDGRRED